MHILLHPFKMFTLHAILSSFRAECAIIAKSIVPAILLFRQFRFFSASRSFWRPFERSLYHGKWIKHSFWMKLELEFVFSAGEKKIEKVKPNEQKWMPCGSEQLLIKVQSSQIQMNWWNWNKRGVFLCWRTNHGFLLWEWSEQFYYYRFRSLGIEV